MAKNESLPEYAHPMDDAIEKKKSREALSKVGFIFLTLLLVLFTALYFSLPAFQVRGIRYAGLDYLDDEDMERLSGRDPRSSLLALDTRDMAEDMLDCGLGLIRGLTFSGGMFSLSCLVEEAHPVLRYRSETVESTWLSSGKMVEDVLSELSSSLFSVESKKTLPERLAADASFVPVAHLPVGFVAGDVFSSGDFLTGLGLFDAEVLSSVSEIQFLGEGNELDKMDILLSGGLLLLGLPVEKAAILFEPPSFQAAKKAMLDAVEKLGLLRDDYRFIDDGTVVSVYRFSYSDTLDADAVFSLDDDAGKTSLAIVPLGDR